MTSTRCILALDLGTSAFKASPVSPSGLVAEPVVIAYDIDYTDNGITCPPERYYDTAMEALRQTIASARGADCRVDAIGISSQAQTFVALDNAGAPLSDAVVWLDNRAVKQAEQVSQAIPDVSGLCGFRQLTGQQFLPKVMHLLNEGRIKREAVGKFLLLNEYLARRLTGVAYGDETNQGMGGFFDITARAWSPAALEIAGIVPEQLASVAPAAAQSAPLLPEVRRALGLDAVPVYLCGNDQTCGAAGVDLQEPGSVLCNFGTAMVVYTRKPELPDKILDTQIAGIDPLTSRCFLLGLEPECGKVVEWLADRVYPGQGIEQMLGAAAKANSRPACRGLPRFSGSITLTPIHEYFDHVVSVSDPATAAQSVLDSIRASFIRLLADVRRPETPGGPLIASGGLSRSRAWLDFLEQSTLMPFVRAPSEHPGLLGIARIIAQNRRYCIRP